MTGHQASKPPPGGQGTLGGRGPTALNRANEGVASFRHAIALHPSFAEAYNDLCYGLTQLDELDDAIGAGRRAIEVKPDYADAHNNYGNALAEAGRAEDAIAANRSALAIRPKFVGGSNNLGVALLQEARARKALKVLDTRLEIDPGNMLALSTKSIALNDAGEREALWALIDYDMLLRELRVEPGSDFAGIAAFNDALARHVCAHLCLLLIPSAAEIHGFPTNVSKCE